MIDSKQITGKSATFRGTRIVTIVFALLSVAGLYGQENGSLSAPGTVKHVSEHLAELRSTPHLPAALIQTTYAAQGASWITGPSGRGLVAPRFAGANWQQQAPSSGASRSMKRKVLGAIVGGIGGFFAGGFLGAKIEGDCNCDDPGLRGAVIGAPIGGIAGSILGYKFLF
jgi:hypothetical protein